MGLRISNIWGWELEIYGVENCESEEYDKLKTEVQKLKNHEIKPRKLSFMLQKYNSSQFKFLSMVLCIA